MNVGEFIFIIRLYPLMKTRKIKMFDMLTDWKVDQLSQFDPTPHVHIHFEASTLRILSKIRLLHEEIQLTYSYVPF